jgi:hypothetical protein
MAARRSRQQFRFEIRDLGLSRRRFVQNGLIAAGIAIAIITAVNGVGTNLNTMFGSVSTSLK